MSSRFNKLVKWLLNLNNLNIILLGTVSIIILVIIFILLYKFILSIYSRLIKKSPIIAESHLNQTRRTLAKDTKAYVLKISEKKMNKFKKECLKSNLTYSLCLDNFVSSFKGGKMNG